MARHVVFVGILWVVLTAIGLALASIDIYPTTGSPEAKDFDDIFTLLMYLAMPVVTFVFAMLIYGIILWGRWRAPTEDGPVMYGHGWIPRIWLLITGGLAALVIVTPGLTGLNKLQNRYSGAGWGAVNAPLTIQVTGQQFVWTYQYFDGLSCPLSVRQRLMVAVARGATLPTTIDSCTYLLDVGPTPAGQFGLIKLPLGEEVKFEINSVDVLHSFWIPAFRTKIDAIPGRTTFMTVKPDVLGRYDDDPAYRVQCAELCGVDHTVMRTRLDVVTDEEFKEWVAQEQEAGQ